MNNYDFKSVYEILGLIYDLSDLSEHVVENLGMFAWDKIGSKQYAVYELKIPIEDHEIELPCNVGEIIGVFGPYEDIRYTANDSVYPQVINSVIEQYIENRKLQDKINYHPGKLIQYRHEGNKLKFAETDITITLVYKGWIANDDGLPYLTDKQTHAIAAYIAYVTMWKMAKSTTNNNIVALAQKYEQDWRRLCDNARVPESINKNEMDIILNARSSWNRKQFNMSYK